MGGKHPFDLCAGCIASPLPGVELGDRRLSLAGLAIEALTAQHADPGVNHVELHGVFGHVVEFEARQQATRLWVLHYDYQSTIAQIMWARVRDDFAPYDKVCRDEFSAAKAREHRGGAACLVLAAPTRYRTVGVRRKRHRSAWRVI